MDIEIRRASLDDVENLIKNRIDFQYELGGNPDDEFVQSTRDYLNDHMLDDSFVCYLAVLEGHIIASVILCLYNVIPTTANINGKVGYVFNVYTLQEFRRQGLASKLLKCGIDEAKKRGVGELFLEAQDAGKGVYENLGFKMLQREMHLDLR